MAKLTDRDRENVVEMYKKGMDMRSIAEVFGVTCGTISITLKRLGVKARRSGRRFFHID